MMCACHFSAREAVDGGSGSRELEGTVHTRYFKTENKDICPFCHSRVTEWISAYTVIGHVTLRLR